MEYPRIRNSNLIFFFSFFFREARELAEQKAARAQRPKIQTQFTDLKRGLSAVTDEEWENLPEVNNLTKRPKVRESRSYVVPDSVLVGDRSKVEYESSLDMRQQKASILFVAVTFHS